MKKICDGKEPMVSFLCKAGTTPVENAAKKYKGNEPRLSIGAGKIQIRRGHQTVETPRCGALPKLLPR